MNKETEWADEQSYKAERAYDVQFERGEIAIQPAPVANPPDCNTCDKSMVNRDGVVHPCGNCNQSANPPASTVLTQSVIKCDYYKDGCCYDSIENFSDSCCSTCECNKDKDGNFFVHPRCVLLCDCEEEACNIGEIMENN